MSSPPVSNDQGGFKGILSPSRQVNGPVEYMGLLSQTLAPSPVVRWILPARIRSRRHRDIVFVGNTYIQLREFLPTGTLTDVTAKLDLRTHILSAKVISAKVEKVPTLDAVLAQEVDEERFIIKGKPCSNEQPPQILVLGTANNELIYVYAKTIGGSNAAEFVYAKRALLLGVSMSPRFTRHIAIDPECKVMAVAADSSFAVLSLKEVDELKASIDEWDPGKSDSFQPNIEQRLIQVDGFILKMEFLRPSEDRPEKAILILIVAHAGESALLLYEWDVRDPLIEMTPMRSSGQNLPEEDAFPLLLIPSSRRATFAIVTETQIVYYDDVRSRKPNRVWSNIPPGGESAMWPLWVQWAKPARHDNYSNQNEDILIVREDGTLRIVTRPHSPHNVGARNFTPGTLPRIAVDSAICMLPGPRGKSGDTLIVGGSMTDGQVFHLPPRESIATMQVLSNVTPIHDMAILDAAATRQRDTRARRTFVTAGLQESSTLNELRIGLDAPVWVAMPYPDGATLNRMWTLEHESWKTLYILTSHPEYTSGLALDVESDNLEMIDSSQFPGMQFDASTLAAAILASGITVQITVESIRLEFEKVSPITQSLGRCVCADIEEENGGFAIAYEKSQQYQIAIGMISVTGDRPAIHLSHAHYQSSERPLCLQLFGIAKSPYLAVGYHSGYVEVFSVNGEGGLLSLRKYLPDTSGASAITSIVVLVHEDTRQALALAGSRNGQLHVLSLKLPAKVSGATPEPEFQLQRIYHLGSTAVTIVHDYGANTYESMHALVGCGTRLDRITYFRNNVDADFMLSSIWMTVRNDPTYTTPAITSVQTIRNLGLTGGDDFPHGLFLCATMEDILFTSLIPQEQLVPRRLGSEETGARLMVFSKTLGKFVMASDSTSDAVAGSRTPVTLSLIDPYRSSDQPDSTMRVMLGEDNERVKALITWEPTDGRSHFDLIMVGLSDDINSRVGFVASKKLANDPQKASFKSLMRFSNKSLHALCPLEKSSLMVSVGKEIVIMRLDVSTRRWYEDARYGLPSPALSISAQGSVIYAATASHSTIVLKWDRAGHRFEKMMTDRVARNSKVVLPFGTQGDHLLVATAADRGTSLLAYSIVGPTADAPTPLFQAELPVSLDHIVTIPSVWPDSAQQAFQGISFDGTLYILKTLTLPELKLLRYVVELAEPNIDKPVKGSVPLLTERMSRSYIRALKDEHVAPFDPAKMHVNGDIVKRVVDAGTSHLRALLRSRIKSEDEMIVDDNSARSKRLESLARPLIGQAEDVPAAVIVWMRKILRSTVF